MSLKGALPVKFDVKSPADKFFSAFVETNRPIEKNGKTEFKALDMEKKTMTIEISGSEIQKHFKTLNGSIAVTPIEDGDGSHVVWTFEFEKVHKDIDDPHSIIDESVKYFKKLDEVVLKFNE